MEKRQGQIWNVNCNPSKGSEPGKVRPCLIVQTDALNCNHPKSYLCVLLTSNIQENSLIREQIPEGICSLNQTSTAIIDQLTAFDESRFKKVLGKGESIPKAILESIINKIHTLFKIIE